jgi:type I restriction-modification system DNA methylase subunit
MSLLVEDYIRSISLKFSHKDTSEMGYRTQLEILLKGIFSDLKLGRIDHDAKAKQGNKPDFVVVNGEIPILYLEAKDIGISLDKVEKSDQMARYFGYANLVLTDYVEFRFYRNGIRYGDPIKIANFDIKNRTLDSIPGHYDHLVRTLVEFTQSHKEPIRSGHHLAKVMGGKGRRIRDNTWQYLETESEKDSELAKVFETLKKLLVHDLTPEKFADMYAQTLVYGLFVARFHDESPKDFSRAEARDLIPKSNPFLRHFFDHIVGPNFDKRLEFIVNELCEVFSHADIQELMKEYFKSDLWGKEKKGPDPVIHFYEDFLKEYDPVLRKKMGAYYTPLPVVQFIVNSVDYLLESKFNLPAGLADTSKSESNLHRVQILDPAVGTGTFISNVIGKIYSRILAGNQEGRWPSYVHHDLLPRLHGFELMMAPYTIAHLKLGIAFRKTGFKHFNQRLGIYLTNSLERSAPDDLFTAFGLAESIAEESKEAEVIKSKTPIMVVLGNPPYSGESNNAHYSGNNVYKVEPAGGRLKERNSKWLNDDYVKFIRLAESMVEKNDDGIVAMITAHGYLDNPTFRGMRYHLLQTFEEIYILDLHGNANKKEITPEGKKDENVFDIKTGVSIFIGIKSSAKKENLAKLYRVDCYGLRDSKFDFLNNNSFKDLDWESVNPSAPNFEWVNRDVEKQLKYLNGFSVSDLFQVSGVGVVTARDSFVISNDEDDLIENAKKFRDSLGKNQKDICEEVGISNKKGWDAMKARISLQKEADLEHLIRNISYRPFDTQKIFYHSSLVWRTVEKIMQNFTEGPNIGLVFARSQKDPEFNAVFISKNIIETKFGEASTQSSVAPLYIYSSDGTKVPNLDLSIVASIQKIAGEASPENIFDYVYSVLHSPSYRNAYKEFLKSDFPRVPFPRNEKSFSKLVSLGSELRSVHLLESPKVGRFITSYSVAGSDFVEKIAFKSGKVFINDTQYFGGVPEAAWEFAIGGYQPAQKWLKDRKGQTLTNDDLSHYQKVIVALAETVQIMNKIDDVLDEG